MVLVPASQARGPEFDPRSWEEKKSYDVQWLKVIVGTLAILPTDLGTDRF